MTGLAIAGLYKIFSRRNPNTLAIYRFVTTCFFWQVFEFYLQLLRIDTGVFLIFTSTA